MARAKTRPPKVERRDERRDRVLDRLGCRAADVAGSLMRRCRCPRSSSARRAAASRMALTTASTVSSNRLPSVEMIRASAAARSGATARVESSASRRRRASRMASASGPVGVEAAFLRAPPGTLLGRRVEEDLEVGVGQHDRADVAAGHDDPAGGREVALALEERRPQLRDGRDGGHRGIDHGSADVRRCGRRRRRGRGPGGPARPARARPRPRGRASRAGTRRRRLRASASQVTAR